MSESVLLEIHKSLGAQLFEIEGKPIPSRYSDVESEYFAARRCAAFFDLSHFGKLRITGKDALDFMNRISTNNLAGLRPGMGKQTFLLTEKGRVVDLCTVYVQQESLLVLTSPFNPTNVKKWIEKFIVTDDVAVEDVTDIFPMFFVGGTSAAAFLKHVVHSSHRTLLDIEKMPRHNFIRTFLNGGEVLLARTNMVMGDGFIILLNRTDGGSVWNLLLDKARAYGAEPAGLETFEIFRIENGTPIYPNELNEEVNPWEVNVVEVISEHKGCYVGQEVVARLRTYDKVKRKLVGLLLDSKVSRGSKIYELRESPSGSEVEIGVVTSSAHSPGLNKEIALAYASTAQVMLGSKYFVKVGGKNIEAELSILPFLV
jgi:folate-binding protein YgfZ